MKLDLETVVLLAGGGALAYHLLTQPPPASTGGAGPTTPPPPKLAGVFSAAPAAVVSPTNVHCSGAVPCPEFSNACPAGLSDVVVPVRGTMRCFAWSTVDQGLQQMGYGGPFDHSQAELQALDDYLHAAGA